MNQNHIAPDDSWLLALAWDSAREMRSCPPGTVLFSESRSKNLVAHIEECELCRDRLENPIATESVLSLVERLASDRPVPDHPEVEPGQIWSVGGELEGWETKTSPKGADKHRFISAPWVLTLQTSHQEAVTVAQVYFDTKLQGTDDVPLPEDWEGFVEPWNVYTLRRQDLEDCWGAVPASLVERTLQNAASPTPVNETSLLYRFRTLELEVGFHFRVSDLRQI